MARLALLAALCCSLVAIAHAQMMMGGHGGGMAKPGVAPSGNMTSECYTDPSAPPCKDFMRTHMDWRQDLFSLCIAMPFMSACTLWAECKPLLDATNHATGMSRAAGTYCALTSLVGDVCVEMPRMKGCEAWNALCAPETSVVAQCKKPGPLPAMVPAEGGEANTTWLWTYDVKDAVDAACAAEELEACASCASEGRAFGNCTDPLSTLSKLCAERPELPECEPFQAWCAEEAAGAMFPQLCAGNLTVPPLKPIFPSVNMTDACYADPTAESCKGFRRMHMDWTSDMTSLCNAMPFMAGCTLWANCRPLLDTKNPATNLSSAFGTYCGMVGMVGSVCEDPGMSRMKGCEAYNALCAAPGSVVAACKAPGVVPNLLGTYAAKEAVDDLCLAPEPAQEPACAGCRGEGRAFAACPDPLGTLVQLCDVPEVPEQCANLTAMCSTPEAARVYDKICIGANAYQGAPAPLPAPAAAGAAAAASAAALLLAAALQALLA